MVRWGLAISPISLFTAFCRNNFLELAQKRILVSERLLFSRIVAKMSRDNPCDRRRRAAMTPMRITRIFRFLTLTTTCLALLAASDHRQFTGKRTHVEKAWKKKKERKPPSFDVKDKYWEPCDYASTNGPNACGGGS